VDGDQSGELVCGYSVGAYRVRDAILRVSAITGVEGITA